MKRSPDADLGIVGAGPAGLATAIIAARRGLRAVVLERRQGIGPKACGEGIMPAGVEALDRMGVVIPADECRVFRGIRYVEGDLKAEGRLPDRGGLGVRRIVLLAHLLRAAEAAGVEVRFGSRVDDWETEPGGSSISLRSNGDTLTARHLVGADGLHSRVRRLAGLSGLSDPGSAATAAATATATATVAATAGRGRHGARFGIRRHFEIEPWTDLVEVHLSDGVEAYVTPVGPRLVGVALLFSTGGGSAAPDYDALLSGFPRLERRLDGRTAVDEARGAGPLRQEVTGRIAGPVALVGDAAGYLDALTGQGIELGFLEAEALVDVIARRAPLAEYDAALRRLLRRHHLVTGMLLQATRRRPVRRGLVRLLGSVPGLFDRALHFMAGPPPRGPRSFASKSTQMTSPERNAIGDMRA